jgi:hypothetical protein
VKTLSLYPAFAVVALATVVAFAQSPAAPPAGAPRPPRTYPAPTNLKVLPKDMTGQQVHEVMEKWESELGGHCSSCHTADPTNIGPNGKPRLKFEDDAKDEKVVARLMFAMTEELNKKYFGQMKHDDAQGKAPSVTCATCHRGHMHPEEFVPAREEHGGPMPGMQMPAQK